jgi:tetratricopeptide (TPR) repeat protein
LARSEGERSERRATALHAALGFAERLGDLEVARRYGEESVSIRRELGDPVFTAKGLSALAVVATHAGDFARAERLYGEAIVLAGSADETLRTELTGQLGGLELRRGEYERAIALSEEALEGFSALGRRDGMRWVLWNLAFALSRTNEERGALSRARESLMVAHSVGDVEGIADGLALLASMAMRGGECEAAARVLGAAHTVTAHLGAGLAGPEAEVRESTEEELRRVLAPDEYEAAFTTGNAMSADEAVEYALESLH